MVDKWYMILGKDVHSPHTDSLKKIWWMRQHVMMTEFSSGYFSSASSVGWLKFLGSAKLYMVDSVYYSTAWKYGTSQGWI